jgi:hypothetical protein
MPPLQITVTLRPEQIKDVTIYDDVVTIRTHRGARVRTMTLEHTPDMIREIRAGISMIMDHRSAGTDKVNP